MKSKIIAFDMDDVLCYRTSEEGGVAKYKTCLPLQDMINVVNKCYENGMYIKIYTARGMSTFSGDVSKVYSELYELTKQQLINWGVKHHELVMGKIHFDLLIDDKVVDSLKIKSFSDVERRLEQ
mgnify:CR=1 FL=1|tara:strand:- start:277 stop:648 length:372 start_codon:yes stop_codon:yes gene_type:complete